MIAPLRKSVSAKPAPDRHARFLVMLPVIRESARIAFMNFNPDSREEAIEEVIANAFVAYARLVELGKSNLAYASALARFGIAQVRQGRQVGNELNSKDILSRYAQQKRGFRVGRLDHQNEETGEWKEACIEDSQTPVPDQAAFRIDFPAWLGLHPRRDQQIAEALAIGERTKDVANKFGVSPGRVSQLRRELYDSWREFHGEKTSMGPVAAES